MINEYPAYVVVTRVIMGKKACHRRSAVSCTSKGLFALIPADVAPETGNHWSDIAKIQRRMIPSQKNGIVQRIMEIETDAVSSLLPGRLPVQTPTRMPKMAVITVETPTRKRVQGRYCMIMENTDAG
jgi:hypothetical protein